MKYSLAAAGVLAAVSMGISSRSPAVAQAGGVCECALGNQPPQACGSVPSHCLISPAGNSIWFIPTHQKNGNCSIPPCAPQMCSATVSVVITGTSTCRYTVLVDGVEIGAGVPTTGQPFSVSHRLSLECGQQSNIEVRLAGICQYTQSYTCHDCTH